MIFRVYRYKRNAIRVISIVKKRKIDEDFIVDIHLFEDSGHRVAAIVELIVHLLHPSLDLGTTSIQEV